MIEVKRVSSRIVILGLAVNEDIVSMIPEYGSQRSRSEKEKSVFGIS